MLSGRQHRLSFYPLGCERAPMGGQTVSLSEGFTELFLEMLAGLTTESKNCRNLSGFVRQVKNSHLGFTTRCLVRWGNGRGEAEDSVSAVNFGHNRLVCRFPLIAAPRPSRLARPQITRLGKTVSGSRVAATADESPSPTAATSLPFRIVASVLIIGHLWAVVGRPIEFATQGPFGTSPSATLFRDPVRAYSQFAYLDHGYAFFAPDPGPSHLIAATVTAKDGKVIELLYPDLGDQWPRLMYHRHFMLSEFLNNIYHPPGEPPLEIVNNPVAARDWRIARRRYEAVRDSILECLKKQHPDCEIAIRRLQHRQPGLPEFFEEKIAIDDARLVTILLDEIEPPELPQSQGLTPTSGAATPIGLMPNQSPVVPQVAVPRTTVPRSSSIEVIRPIREEAVSEDRVPAAAGATEAN